MIIALVTLSGHLPRYSLCKTNPAKNPAGDAESQESGQRGYSKTCAYPAGLPPIPLYKRRLRLNCRGFCRVREVISGNSNTPRCHLLCKAFITKAFHPLYCFALRQYRTIRWQRWRCLFHHLPLADFSIDRKSNLQHLPLHLVKNSFATASTLLCCIALCV